jgi:hypothetical protein
MALDRADWHYAGKYPKDLPIENGGTHIGMFLAWAIRNGLEGDELREVAPKELDRVRKRKMTGRQFLFKVCDGKFGEDDLGPEGLAFAHHYFSKPSGKYGKYLDDYCIALVPDEMPSVYHVADTWANYDVIAAVIDERFAAWKKKRSARSRKPPKRKRKGS